MFSIDDAKYYRALKMIINSGSFSFKGDAVQKAASLFKWFDELGVKIEDDLKPKPKLAETSIKELDSADAAVK